MKQKSDIVRDWLPRYTGRNLEDFGSFVLLVNFSHYVEAFAERFGVPVHGEGFPIQSATADNVTILNFGMGSAMAATVMDLLSAVNPQAVLFLGKCGGLKKTKIGDFIQPIAAIAEIVHAANGLLHVDAVQGAGRIDCDMAALGADLLSLSSHKRRVWEHDATFKNYLVNTRAIGIDMETATLFVVGFANHIPKGALLLVSDNPMSPEGVKTSASDRDVNRRFVETHLAIGIDALLELRDSGESVKHMRFEERR